MRVKQSFTPATLPSHVIRNIPVINFKNHHIVNLFINIITPCTNCQSKTGENIFSMSLNCWTILWRVMHFWKTFINLFGKNPKLIKRLNKTFLQSYYMISDQLNFKRNNFKTINNYDSFNWVIISNISNRFIPRKRGPRGLF